MGGGIILLGIMAIIIPEGYVAVAMHGVVQLVSNVTRSYVFRTNIQSSIIRQYTPGALLGLFLSSIIIMILIIGFDVQSAKDIKVDILKPLIGLFIIWFLFGRRPQISDKIQNYFWVGAVSGISTVFIGATGPLIAPFFLKGNLSKKNIIANKAVCQAISHIGKMPLFVLFFSFDYFEKLPVMIPLIIAVLFGTNLGKRILQFLPEKVFRLLFKGSLTIISLKLIINEIIIFIK